MIGNNTPTVSAYPNPVHLEGLDDSSRWELFRADGQRVLSGQGRTLKAKLAAVTYYLRTAGQEVGTLVIKD